ncbi:MAG: hypothetical protein K2X77_26105 [Candidatus Obscuribacterales bacterium]|nr:hypothetical protein [Candidatus Obscuribacterales bacterium]
MLQKKIACSRRSRANALIFIIFATIALAAIGVALVQFGLVFGGANEVTGLVDAGTLNVGKFASKPDVVLTPGVQSQFQEFGKDGGSNITIAEINRVLGKAALMQMNAASMLEHGQSTSESDQHGEAAVAAAEEIASKLSDQLSDKKKLEKYFSDITSRGTLKLFGGQTKVEPDTNGWAVSYVDRGEESNIAIDPGQLPEGFDLKKIDAHQGSDGKNYFKGYTPIKIGNKQICFVPFKGNEQPHLISGKTFEANLLSKNPLGAWSKPIPNAFACQGKAVGEKGLSQHSRAFVQANPGKKFDLTMGRAFVRIKFDDNQAHWFLNGQQPQPEQMQQRNQQQFANMMQQMQEMKAMMQNGQDKLRSSMSYGLQSTESNSGAGKKYGLTSVGDGYAGTSGPMKQATFDGSTGGAFGSGLTHSRSDDGPTVLPNGSRMITDGGATMLAGDSGTLISNGSASLISNAGGTMYTNGQGSLFVGSNGAIMLNGTSLVGNSGNTLVGNNGNSIVSDQGSGLLSDGGGGLISNKGGGFLSDAGGALISNKGGGLLSDGGGGLISNKTGGILSDQAGGLIGDAGSTLISNKGGGILSDAAGGILSNANAGILSNANGGLTGQLAQLNGLISNSANAVGGTRTLMGVGGDPVQQKATAMQKLHAQMGLMEKILQQLLQKSQNNPNPQNSSLSPNSFYGFGPEQQSKSFPVRNGTINVVAFLGNEYTPDNLWQAVCALDGDYGKVKKVLVQRIRQIKPDFKDDDLKTLLEGCKLATGNKEYYIYPDGDKGMKVAPKNRVREMVGWLNADVNADGNEQQIGNDQKKDKPNWPVVTAQGIGVQALPSYCVTKGSIFWRPGTGFDGCLGELRLKRETDIFANGIFAIF